MSWGYFAELDLRLPSTALATLKKARPADVPLPAGWSGLNDRGLEGAFGRRTVKNESFADTLGWYRREGSRHREQASGDHTALRVLTMLEKSILDEAFPLVTLFFAAREHGGEGTLRLVNDGTSGGEFGVELTLANGAITSRPIEDDWDLVGRLGEELFALPPPPKGKVAINPVTGLPMAPAAARVAINPFTGQPLGAAPKEPPAEKASAKKIPPAKTSQKRPAGTKAKASGSKATPRKTVGKPKGSAKRG